MNVFFSLLYSIHSPGSILAGMWNSQMTEQGLSAIRDRIFVIFAKASMDRFVSFIFESSCIRREGDASGFSPDFLADEACVS